ncbi:MAG TPA: ATP-binding protein [Terriglobia bacterium]|nr:ATP-binding protein [Terriglobia bacterium]
MRLKNSVLRRFLLCALLPAIATVAIAAAVHLRIAEALVLAFVLAVATAWFSARALRQRINRLKAFAENLVHSGPPPVDPLPDFEGELGAMARSLSQAAEQWQGLLEQLRLESARRAAILKAMVEGVLAVDQDLRVIFCNDSFARLVGAQLPLPSRLPLLNLVRDPSLRGMLAQVLAEGHPVRQTLQLAAADSRVFEVQAAPLSEPDRPGAIAILHDVTDLERLERVRKDFVANVSHELRTPLTAIRGYAETLLDGALEDPDENRKFLGIILNHAVRLNNIASDLLVLSELESGRNQPEPQRISVRAAVEGALRAVEAAAERANVRLVIGKIDDAEVAGSGVRLEQALVNLLDNAVKFNRPSGAVRVEAERQTEGAVSITVSDNGIGIPSDDLTRIFERFYRVDRARSREAGGTGLGLSIVKHAVERMGGTVRVESQVGKGSAFTVTLPADPKTS